MKKWTKTEHTLKISFEEMGLPSNLIHRKYYSIYGDSEQGLIVVGTNQLQPFPGVDEYIANFLRRHLIDIQFKGCESWSWRYRTYTVMVGENPPIPKWVYDHYRIATCINVTINCISSEELSLKMSTP